MLPDAPFEAMKSWPETVSPELLSSALHLLSEPQRQIVRDWFYSGSSITEIAERNALSLPIVREQLRDGLECLRALLEEKTL